MKDYLKHEEFSTLSPRGHINNVLQEQTPNTIMEKAPQLDHQSNIINNLILFSSIREFKKYVFMYNNPDRVGHYYNNR